MEIHLRTVKTIMLIWLFFVIHENNFTSSRNLGNEIGVYALCEENELKLEERE